MTIEPVCAPTVDAPVDELVDWLELVAFFNRFRTARLDVLDGAISTQAEEEIDWGSEEDQDVISDDFGEADTQREALRERVENEVNSRSLGCDASYPFSLSDDGEELELKDGWQKEQYSAYLVCLLASHMKGSSILQFEVSTELESTLRNRVFQIISTFALSGFVQGPAASIGWPRQDKESILDTLKRAKSRGAGFTLRDEPGPYTSHAAKDGGIDIIAWRKENIPPPTLFYYGQVASGRNWEGKPVSYHRENFEGSYMLDRPMVERNSATIMPFRILDQQKWHSEHHGHGRIFERTRVHKYVALGIAQVKAGVQTDEAQNLPSVMDWIDEFRKKALASLQVQ